MRSVPMHTYPVGVDEIISVARNMRPFVDHGDFMSGIGQSSCINRPGKAGTYDENFHFVLITSDRPPRPLRK